MPAPLDIIYGPKKRVKKKALRIAIVSLFTEEIKDIVLHTAANHSTYATKHGYDYKLLYGRLSKRHPAWDKIKAIQIYIDQYDYVLWIDSDAIFKDLSISLEDILQGRENYDGLFGKDPAPHIYVNTGVFLLKNTEWSKDLLNHVWKNGAENVSVVNRDSYVGWPFEQGPICEYLEADQKDHHFIVPDYILNAHPSFVSPKTFIIHYMGYRATNEKYVETLQTIKEENRRLSINQIEVPTIPVFFITPRIAYKNTIHVESNGIEAVLNLVINKDGTAYFHYDIKADQYLSHAFQINGKVYQFNSSEYNEFSIEDTEFDLYHSADWFGKTYFKFVDHVSLK